MQPRRPPEQYADMLFPIYGLDLSMSFGSQRDETTRVGQNVRAFEPAERRARGGARNGLTRYINDQVGGSAHLIQHLNYVVDPQAQGTTWYDPPYPDPNNPSGPGIAGGPNLTTPGPNGDGTYIDPLGHRIRYGGTGVSYSKKRKAKTISLLQSKVQSFISSGSPVGTPFSTAFTTDVSTGDLLAVAVPVYHPFPGTTPSSVTVSDSRGNFWSLATSATTGVDTSMWLFQAVAATAGPCTVTVVLDTQPVDVSLVMLEYSGTDFLLPRDGLSSANFNGDTPGSMVASSGSVPVGHAGDVVVGFFAVQASAATFLPAAPASSVADNQASVVSTQIWVTHKIGQASALAMAGTITAAHVFAWVVIGVSFLPQAT